MWAVPYAVLDVREEILAVETIRVDYDYEHTAREIEEAGLPKEFAQIIRTGKYNAAAVDWF